MGPIGRSIVVGLVFVVLAGCERQQSPTPPPAAAKRDAAPSDAAVIDANDVREKLAQLPAPYPPPAPPKHHHARGDCRTEYSPRPDRDPTPMCLVKGGAFMMGGGRYAPDPVPHATKVKDFYIDQFEVTTQQAVLFLNAHGNSCPGLDHTDQEGPFAHQCIKQGVDVVGEHVSKPYLEGIIERDGRFAVRPGYGMKPEVNFSLEGAMRYCEWVGKTVPSSAQWEYAARHDPSTNKDLTYPWGDDWLPDHAACWNPTGTHKPELVPTVGMFDGTRGRADGSSPWGVHDMTGGGTEIVFACSEPDETCRPGAACACEPLGIPGDHEDVAALATSARYRLNLVGDEGVRCLRALDR